MKHVLITVDVEDWFQVENLRALFPLKTWNSQELRIQESTRRILGLLDSLSDKYGNQFQATFFVLGWIARRMPKLVREIKAAGHEVASHGDNHVLCAELSETDLLKDLSESKKLLEDILQSPVYGYRAPSFSISQRILELIREAGYRYDASYNAFGLNSRYGRPDFSLNNKKGIALDLGQGFYELPITNLSFGRRSFPCSGGGYFRLLPGPLFRLGVRLILQRQGAYHFYMHPWEVDPEQPRINELSAQLKFRHYVNLHKTLFRLQKLLDSFSECRFISCKDYLRQTFNLSSNLSVSAEQI